MYFLVFIVGFLAAASAKNLTVGVGGGHLIYEQNKTASPAIWKQQEQLTVNVSDSEVITQVVVVDCREDQNGEASILEGGVGTKNVTLLLKSPSILRGYCFEVYVYALPDEGQVHIVDNNQQTVDVQQVDNNQQTVDGQQTVHHKIPEVSTTSTSQVPSVSTSTVPDGQQEIQHPVQVSHGQDQVRPSRHTEGQEQKPLIPALVDKDETDKERKNPLDDVHKELISQIFEEDEDYSTQGPRTETTVAPVATGKTTEVDGQQTELPLPYVTGKSVQTQKPDLQEVQKVKTL